MTSGAQQLHMTLIVHRTTMLHCPFEAPTTMRSIMNVIKRLKTKAWVSGERAAGSNQIKAVAGIQNNPSLETSKLHVNGCK
jgi:hypothetical protein